MRVRRGIVSNLIPAAGIVTAFLVVAGATAWSSTDAARVNVPDANGAAAEVAEAVPDATPSIAPSVPRTEQVNDPGRGFVPPGFDLPPIEARPQLPAPLVDRFDWREAGALTPIKNQGSCGSCYAFASIASFESKVLVDGGAPFNFSENNVKECEWYGSSCSGGNYWRVANYLAAVGTVLEACDPYVAGDVACNSSCAPVKTLLDWREFSHETVASTEVIKAYLQTYGPIYTSMYAGTGDTWGTEFNNYNGSYTLYYAGAGSPNHAVLIVGWDDTLTHAGGTGAWIVRNSWGTSWGGACGYGTERGYFYIAYGSAQIGTWASFLADWQDNDPTGFFYYYDEAGYTSSVGYGVTTAWGFCKYQPADDIVLRRVEFWTADATTDIDVYVYDTFSGSALSGLLASRLNSTFDLPGYHSVELSTAPEITAGNDIYVVVKFTDATYKYPLVYDSQGPKSAGNCYISSNGSSWSAWTMGDLGIRLRASENPSCGIIVVQPTLADIVDVPSDNGGAVRLSWRRSIYDAESSSPQILRYKVWRRMVEGGGALLAAPQAGALEEAQPGHAPLLGDPPAEGVMEREYDESGSVWEMVGVIQADQSCTYTLDVPTECNGTGCMTQFYVSAVTGVPTQRYNSPPDSGYSLDNLLQDGEPDATPVPGAPETAAEPKLLSPEPNPGSEGFAIGFELGSPDWVRLEIYDISGRRVASILDEYAEAGLHHARWDGKAAGGADVAPGIYFARLLTLLQARTVKLVVAR